ncbi:MAG: ornithine carbamoyltransferase [Candidatus Hydrothermarchaeota archaeon]
MNFISILDLKAWKAALDDARKMKRAPHRTDLRQRTLGLVFEKASTRTRVSFEVAMTQLGGHAIYLDWKSSQLGRGESIKDTARVLGRYLDGVVMRARSHRDVVELGSHAGIPVINGLSDLEHPCQALSDLFTIREREKGFKGVKLAYVGDGNNVCNSLLLGSAMVGMDVAVATPKGYEPPRDIVNRAKKLAAKTGSRVELLRDPAKAVEGADYLYTDVWVSMGQEKEEAERMRAFQGFQINRKLVKQAGNPYIMHCLPAHRGLEITDEVIDGKRSIVLDQAENRLHVQKALLVYLLKMNKSER